MLMLIEYVPYILIFLIILIILIKAFIRIKYGFWAIQPVFHVYNFNYMLFPPGVIEHDLPKPNKYTNFNNIKTQEYTELTTLKKNKIVQFIQSHYLQNGDNIFKPKKENIFPYFDNHNTSSFITFYNEKTFMQDLKKGTIIEDEKLIGMITSRPIHICINNTTSKLNDPANMFDAYYVDYLCVDKKHRKQGIAPQLIQTHNYNQRYHNKNISVCLFKREDELTGIVPLCVYQTYGFQVYTWTKPTLVAPPYMMLEITAKNIHLLSDFMKETNTFFDISIYTDMGNIIELIKTNNIFVNAVTLDSEIVCVYFFRKTCVFVEKDLEALSCFASINNTSEDVFIQGFKNAFWSIAEKHLFGFAVIENISHNNMIINNLIVKTKPYIISPTAYFFYNFAYPTFKSSKTFILC
jgi:GNAT superfamily N-acetyltransferase